MPALSEARITELLAPYLSVADGESEERAGSATICDLPELYRKCAAYLDLLIGWNARTNLTAIREPEEIVRRHFGESLCAGLLLSGYLRDGASVLDVGSGAGFPGLPVQLLLPKVQVTLAESQGKKAAFLREAVRVLGAGAEVWARRVEEMPADVRFGAVMLRGVDHIERVYPLAVARVGPGGYLLEFSTAEFVPDEGQRLPGLSKGWIRMSRPIG